MISACSQSTTSHEFQLELIVVRGLLGIPVRRYESPTVIHGVMYRAEQFNVGMHEGQMRRNAYRNLVVDVHMSMSAAARIFAAVMSCLKDVGLKAFPLAGLVVEVHWGTLCDL